MSDDNVIDLPMDYLPTAVRVEMERRKQESEGRAGPPAAIPPLPDELAGDSGMAKKSDPLPESPHEPYRPYAGLLSRLKAPERTFYCVDKDCTFRGFPYSCYDGISLEASATPGGGLVIAVRFNTRKPVEVRIGGTGNLRFLAMCIGLGIMPWVWLMPDHHDAGGGTSITDLTIVEIK